MKKKTTTGISGCLMILLFFVKVFEQIHNGFIEYIPNNEEQYGKFGIPYSSLTYVLLFIKYRVSLFIKV